MFSIICTYDTHTYSLREFQENDSDKKSWFLTKENLSYLP